MLLSRVKIVKVISWASLEVLVVDQVPDLRLAMLSSSSLGAKLVESNNSACE
jgi:hypothetical protein